MIITTTTKTDVENKIKNAFNFTVDKFPLSGPENMKTPWYGLFRSDTMQVVGKGSKTARYYPHQTNDVIALANAAGQTFDGKFDVQCHFNDGHRVIVQPTEAERLNVYGQKDNVLPRIIINAGYDGKAFKGTMGFYRDLCRNLMCFESVKSTTISIRHTSGLPNKMDSLISAFGQLVESWQLLKTQIMKMEETKIDFQWLLNEVFPKKQEQTPRQLISHDRMMDKIISRLHQEAAVNNRPIGNWDVTGWEAYNAIQGYIQHDAPTRKSLWIDRALHATKNSKVKLAEELILAA